MNKPVRVSFDVARAVLESVAERLERDDGLRRAGVSISIARGAEGKHIERVTLDSANGTFELLAQDDGIFLGSLKEWPLHEGDEQHSEKAAEYLAALMRAEAAGTAFHRVSVQQFSG